MTLLEVKTLSHKKPKYGWLAARRNAMYSFRCVLDVAIWLGGWAAFSAAVVATVCSITATSP